MKKRENGIECLRIVSMLFIVCYHFLYWGGVLDNAALFSGTYFYSWTVNAFVHVMVNVFVLITGYYMVASKVKARSILRFALEVWLVSVTVYAVLCVTGQIGFSIKDALFAVIPILSRDYWFATNYMGLLILIPALNLYITKTTKKQMTWTLIVLAGLFSVVPSVVFFSDGLKFGNAHGIVWFVVLYFTGGYLRLHKDNISPKTGLLVWLVCSLLLAGYKFGMDALSTINIGGRSLRILHNYSVIYYQYNALPVYLASIGFFVFFKGWNPRENGLLDRAVRFFAPVCFYVYLIHDNCHFRFVLWEIIDPLAMSEQVLFIPLSLLTVLLVFAACAAIGKVYALLVAALTKTAIFSKIEHRVDCLLNIQD